jgi:hypothetical protein
VRIVLLLLVGCAAEREECSHDPLRSPGGLVVTEAEHGVGWQREDCFQCHQTWNIHQVDCIGSLDVDLAEVRAAADPEDASTCVSCHGDNGLEGGTP